MKATDRSILLGLVILGLLACFWFLLLAPKRERAGELETKVSDLQAEVTQQELLATAAEQAQADYATNYQRLVTLGEAAPADGDTPSLLAQLSSEAERSGTKFGSLTAGGEGEVPAAPAPAQSTTDQNAEEGVPTSATPVEGAVPAPATEASAALLPLGATVGPAGLGVMPYALTFQGDFFQIADLLESLDGQVKAGQQTKVGGRLVTVNGFTMAMDDERDALDVELQIATYVLPESQGLTAGATPTTPPATVPPATPTPTSTTTAP